MRLLLPHIERALSRTTNLPRKSAESGGCVQRDLPRESTDSANGTHTAVRRDRIDCLMRQGLSREAAIRYYTLEATWL